MENGNPNQQFGLFDPSSVKMVFDKRNPTRIGRCAGERAKSIEQKLAFMLHDLEKTLNERYLEKMFLTREMQMWQNLDYE